MKRTYQTYIKICFLQMNLKLFNTQTVFTTKNANILKYGVFFIFLTNTNISF